MTCSNCGKEKLEQRNAPTRDQHAPGKLGDEEFQLSLKNYTDTVNHHRSNGALITGNSYSVCVNCGTVAA